MSPLVNFKNLSSAVQNFVRINFRYRFSRKYQYAGSVFLKFSSKSPYEIVKFVRKKHCFSADDYKKALGVLANLTPILQRNHTPSMYQAVVGCIVWAFRRLNKPKSRKMSARSYALHSVCPFFSFRFPPMSQRKHSATILYLSILLKKRTHLGLRKSHCIQHAEISASFTSWYQSVQVRQ